MKYLWIGILLSIVWAQPTVQLLPESFVRYEARDKNFSWQGRAAIASLELKLEPDNLSASSLRVVVSTSDFTSGNIFRDADARRIVFEFRDYPEIVFEATRIRSQENSLREGSQELDIVGILRMHGVEREISSTVSLELQASSLRAVGGFDVLLSDFAMKRPSLLGITVDDEINISFDIRASLEPR